MAADVRFRHAVECHGKTDMDAQQTYAELKYCDLVPLSKDLDLRENL
jgi:hypothetical protein